MTKMTSIGERIRELRKEHRLSLDGAALKFHVDKSTWSRIETGKREPPVQFIIQLCKEWHVSADYLLFDKKENENQVDLNGFTFSQIAAVKTLLDTFRRS